MIELEARLAAFDALDDVDYTLFYQPASTDSDLLLGVRVQRCAIPVLDHHVDQPDRIDALAGYRAIRLTLGLSDRKLTSNKSGGSDEQEQQSFDYGGKFPGVQWAS